MTRYPLSTPLRVLRGGSDQEITATSDVMEMARTFSGGWLGTSSSVVALISLDDGPVPARLNACTTTPYWANFFRLSSV